MMKLSDLKAKYAELAKKYKLPSFQELNENFEIETIRKETDLLPRAVRKVMMNKVANALNFMELLLNPANAPRFYMGFIKAMGTEGQKYAEKVYSDLADLVGEALPLEIDYSEKAEAEMIIKINDKWSKIKPDFRKVIEHMTSKHVQISKERSYYG